MRPTERQQPLPQPPPDPRGFSCPPLDPARRRRDGIRELLAVVPQRLVQAQARRCHYGRGQGAPFQEQAQRVGPDVPRRRRHHRRRYLFAHRHCGRALRRPRHHHLVRPRRRHLGLRRPGLLRIRLHDARLRLGLLVRLRNPRRGARLPRRVGPDPRVPRLRLRRRRRLGRLPRGLLRRRLQRRHPGLLLSPRHGADRLGGRGRGQPGLHGPAVQRRRPVRHPEPARDGHLHRPDDRAGGGHQGDGVAQQRGGGAQGHHHPDLHLLRHQVDRPRQLQPLHPPERGRQQVRLARHLQGRCRRVLRLPWLRRRHDRRAGGRQAAARSPHRHHGLARYCHHPLHCHGHSDDRSRPLLRARHRCPRFAGHPGDRPYLARRPHRLWRPPRSRHRRPRLHHGPAPHLCLHGPRRPAPPALRQGERKDRHPHHPHHYLRRPGLDRRRHPPHRLPGQSDVGRHPPGLLPRLGRAAHQPPPVPERAQAVQDRRARQVRRLLRVDLVRPRSLRHHGPPHRLVDRPVPGHLARARLGRHRAGDLLPLRRVALEPRPPREMGRGRRDDQPGGQAPGHEHHRPGRGRRVRRVQGGLPRSARPRARGHPRRGRCQRRERAEQRRRRDPRPRSGADRGRDGAGQHRGAAEQRRHEQDLSARERMWDKGARGLLFMWDIVIFFAPRRWYM